MVRPNLSLGSAEPPNLNPNRILGEIENIIHSLWLTVVERYAYSRTCMRTTLKFKASFVYTLQFESDFYFREYFSTATRLRGLHAELALTINVYYEFKLKMS